MSSVISLTSEPPQGSNLGPLLFLLFNNDIAEALSCMKLLFVYDIEIFNIITSEYENSSKWRTARSSLMF